MTEEELKLIEQMARKAALASFLGAENVGGNLMETLLVQKIANDFQTMSNFKKENALPTNTKQIIESITPQTPIQKENITPQINEELETPYTLKGKILHSENPIVKAKDNLLDNFKKFGDKYKGLGPIEALQKAATKIPFPNTEAEYYGISTKMADGEDMTKRAKEQNTFYKLKDIQDPEVAKNLREIMAKSKKLDINNPENFEEIQNTNVVIPKSDSNLYKHAKNSEVTEKWIAKNYDKLKNGTITDKEKTIEYPRAKDTAEKRALYFTIHRADLKNTKLNKDGSMDVKLNDIYDFDKMEKEKLKTNNLKNFFNNIYVDINNRAYSQQQKGQIEPYSIDMNIKYTPEEIEKILKKYGYI